ncbi:MAG: LysR family transcriptional regulator [Acetobacteraceae bacterium]|nr:LysR family transcriptional regulator [Acetobacteraceae bacterium]
MPDRKRTERLDWEDLRYGLALAQAGSLSAAARALRVNHATVARRLASLEAALGRVLFDRRPEGYVPTPEGRAVLEEARAMEEAALAVLRRLDAGTALAGPVRLTTTRSLADGFLTRRLGAFRAEYPGIDLEVIAELRVMSLSRREADIAVRLGRPRDSALTGRCVARMGFGFYAAPAWRDRLGAGEAPVLVGYDADSDFVPEAGWLNARFGEARFAFRSNSQLAQAEAARAGFGIALLPHYVAAGDAGLVPIPLGPLPPPREVWLLVRPDLLRVPRIRAVADHLAASFAEARMMLATG